jgi:hypothetical protein
LKIFSGRKLQHGLEFAGIIDGNQNKFFETKNSENT